MCSNSAMKCHCARHLWWCNLTHWIPLSLTHQMSPSLNGDRQRGAPYCEIPRKLDNANSLSVRHLHRFVSEQAMTPEVKENTVSKPSSNDGVCRVFAGLVTLKEFDRTTFSTWIVSSVLLLRDSVVFSFKRLGRNWPNGFTSDTRSWYPKSEFTSLESSGVSLSIAIPLQLCPEKLEKLQGVWIGYSKLMQQLFKGCDSQDDAHRCTNTTYSKYHKRTVSAPSKKTNGLLDGRPSWTWRIDPEKPSGLWRNMADPWVLLAWKLTHDSYIHHVFAICCVLIMFTQIYATGSSSYAV